jgi:hypothetical protein
MANISDLESRMLAISRPGLPYRPNVSHVGKRKRRSISKPLTAGGTSGMIKTKPSDEDGGSECIVTSPSIFKSVEASIRALAWG